MVTEQGSLLDVGWRAMNAGSNREISLLFTQIHFSFSSPPVKTLYLLAVEENILFFSSFYHMAIERIETVNNVFESVFMAQTFYFALNLLCFL